MTYDTNTHAALVKALGIEALSPEDQEMALERSGALVYQAVITRALEEMDEPAVDAFEKLLEENPTPESVLAFFTEKIPNFEAMIAEEAKQFADLGKV
jgi:hypothetical protein